MKKIFCDCCGKEFQYNEETAVTSGVEQETQIQMIGSKLMQKRNMDFSINIQLHPVKGQLGNGDHIDICADCRWRAVNSLDHRPKDATPKQTVPPYVPQLIADRIKENEPISNTSIRDIVIRVLKENGFM
jgi:hypothetical protein